LDVDNVCTVLEGTFNLSGTLKSICLKYIYSNYIKVIASKSYNELSEKLRQEIQEHFDSEKESALHSFMNTFSQDDYKEIAYSMKMEIGNFLKQHLGHVTINTETGTTHSPIGTINYTISDLIITIPDNKPVVDDKDITVTFGDKTVVIEVKNMNIQLKNVNWEYKTESFPHVSDEGKIDATLSDMTVNLLFDIVAFGLGVPALKVKSFAIEIGKCDIHFHSSKVSWLYNAIVKVFSKKD